jgi:RimJ/RimL family protein N-acetyltransferase
MPDLTFRPLRSDDLDAFHAIVSQWDVVRQMGTFPWPPDRRFTARRCQPFTGKGFVWAICDGARFLGKIGVTYGTMGYFLTPEAQGRGIMTRAVRQALDHGFAQYDWEQICASVWADNPGSAAVLRKAGFTHWQSAYERSVPRGLPVLAHYYRLTRADHDGLRSAVE